MSIIFKAATVDEFEPLSGGLRTYLDQPSDISALEAYLVLKQEYGKPERDFLDEQKQQWVFLLKTEGALVEAYDWKQDSWSIAVYESKDDEARAANISKALREKIRRGRGRVKSDLSSILKKEFGQVIENPFYLYYNTATELKELAKRLSIPSAHSESSILEIASWDTEETLGLLSVCCLCRRVA